MRINSVPDVKCFCNNKNVLRAQSTVWHFVRHPVFLASCKRFFNSGFYLSYIIICTHYGLPYCMHIEGT